MGGPKNLEKKEGVRLQETLLWGGRPNLGLVGFASIRIEKSGKGLPRRTRGSGTTESVNWGGGKRRQILHDQNWDKSTVIALKFSSKKKKQEMRKRGILFRGA